MSRRPATSRPSAVAVRATRPLDEVLRIGLAALKIGGGDAPIGAPPSNGVVYDLALENLSGPILNDRPNKYANDVARTIWGRTWHDKDKDRRKQIAEEVLRLVFPNRRSDYGVARVINASNIAQFVAAVNAELQRAAAAAAPPPGLPPPPPYADPPPPGLPPAKKHRKKKPRAPISREETDEEEDPPPPPPDADPPPPPPDADLLTTTLSPDLLTLLLTSVVLSDDPCTRLQELCVVNQDFKELCSNGQLYESVNKNLGWTGVGSAKDIFEQNCSRQFYGLPDFIGRIEGLGLDLYQIASDFQKRLFLRHYAVARFLNEAVEQFHDAAAQGAYGDVEEGDWEASGITVEMSNAVRLGRELMESLKDQWDKVTAYWRSQGIDNNDDAIRIWVRADQDDEDLERKYEETVKGYYQVTLNQPLDKNGLNLALDDFVAAVLAEAPDDDEDDDEDDAL
jgi:hypothetical protein